MYSNHFLKTTLFDYSLKENWSRISPKTVTIEAVIQLILGIVVRLRDSINFYPLFKSSESQAFLSFQG